MSDNIELNAGTGGATIATDDAGAAGHVQVVKLAISTDGSATPIPADATTGLFVDVKASALPTGAATAAKQDTEISWLDQIAASTSDTSIGTAASAASLAIMDDWDETDRAKVNIVAGQAGVTAGAGAVAANTPRVTLASDDPGVSLLNSIDTDTGNIATSTAAAATAAQVMDDWDESDRAKVNPIVGQAGIAAGTGVDGATVPRVTLATNVALPAGTNGIGKLTANSGVDIGDVDVTSISAGANAIGNVGIIPRTSGGMTIFRSLDIDESEEEIKASAGQVFSISAFNTTAAPLFLKFYNLTAANTTVGSSTPVLTFVVPGNADSDGAGFVWNNPIGFVFGTAISVACTTAVADADTGAPGVNACIINVGFA